MSFGISLGDLFVIGKLLRDTVIICKSSIIVQYQDLIWDIQELEETLTEIHHLRCGPDQEAALSNLKRAAQRPRHYVDMITRKVDKYKALRRGEETSKLKKLKARLSWGLTMANEASKARNELILYRIDLRIQQSMYLMNPPMSTQSLDLQHTWFQAPVVVEDALGCKWPVPSEYSWNVGAEEFSH